MKKVILLIFILSITGCSTDEDPITLVLDWTPNTNHTGIYVAAELGYYEDVGLDIDIIQPADNSVPQLVSTDTSDFGITSQEELLYAREVGLPIVGVYGIIHENTSGFISYEDKNIETPKDFEDKTYCGWGSPIEATILENLVTVDGGDFSKVETLSTGGDIFTSPMDECDFFWVFEGWDVIKAEINNYDYNYISTLDYGIDQYTPIIITNEDTLENENEMVKNFIDATLEGYKYASEYPSEAADILLLHAPELEPELIYESQKFLSEKYYIDKPGYMNENTFDEFTNWMISNELMEGINIEGAYTNEFFE